VTPPPNASLLAGANLQIRAGFLLCSDGNHL
jgi:hypothetical protein